MAGGATPRIREGCGEAATLIGEGFSPAAFKHLEMQLCLLKNVPFEMPGQAQLFLSGLNIYQVSKGQGWGTDPRAPEDVGGCGRLMP